MIEINSDCDVKNSVTDAKNRWKNLKDQFRKEVKKIPIPRSGASAPPVRPKWQYFEQMYFLKDFVTPSPTQGNLISCNEDSDEIEELHSVENNESDLHSQPSSPSSMPLRTPSRSSSISQVRKRTKKDIQEEFLSLETKKIEMWQNEAKDNDNADLLFFKSLLPHMADFTEFEKLEIKSDIISLILKKKKKKLPEQQQQILQLPLLETGNLENQAGCSNDPSSYLTYNIM
ncbi:unnamed protein product [Acanthoscelides obtectus]|uniref:MADF domain-containing protein n=1 Tax=Acanthoscelides obtectus TaxID=200917 RepID=A0A9P0NSB3_ACAOB|nr:unnamed protein product [Acanthoscelides obtectus]CAK1639721.1 hypothetical protein AOBTE_LOCUS11331 [Acanthoscelides obtectus]